MQAAGAAMDHPHVILLIHPQPDGPAEQPVIRQGLGPQRINLEHRRLHRIALRLGFVLQHGLANGQPGDAQGEHQPHNVITLESAKVHDDLP